MYTQNFISYSNYGYVALKKQSTSSPVIPDQYLRVINDKVIPSFNIIPINEVAGSRERMRNSVQGTIEVGGPLEFYVEEKMIGHFLRSVFGAPTTQTVTTGAYRHVFEVTTTPLTYTFDIAVANAPWVHRFFNTYITKLTFSQSDNAIKCSAELMPTKAFITARVTTAAASGTVLLVDQNAGLVAGDTILVLDQTDSFTTKATLTVSAVNADGVTLTVSTIGASLAVDDLVVIKRAATSAVVYSQCQPFQFSNGTEVYTGADIDNTAARVTEDFGIEINSETERHFGSGLTEGDRYPYAIVVKGYSATGKLSKFFDSDEYLDKLRANQRMGVRYFMQGTHYVVANSAQKARSNFGSTNGYYVEAATAGKAGNDLNITIVMNTIDTLAASKSGNNILLKLANATAANNTGTLIAAILDALTGVDSTANGDGSQTFTSADVLPNTNLGFKSSGVNVVGADASQKPYLDFDFASGNIKPFFVNNADNSVVMQEVPLDFYYDENCTNTQQKLWSTRVFLFNGVSSY